MAKVRELTKDHGVGEELEIACTQCGPDRAHVVEYGLREYFNEGDGEFQALSEYQIVKCLGCKTLSFRMTHTNSEDYDMETGESYAKVDLYPARENGREQVAGDYFLPSQLHGIYLETLKALNGSQPILAGVGVRAIIETVCKEQKAEGENLYKQIEDLVSKHLLARSGADVLHDLRVLGNDAAHDVKPHDATTLSFAMDVIDNLLSAVYIFPYRARLTSGKADKDQDDLRV